MGKAWLWVISASALAAKSLGSLLSLCGIHSTILPHLHSTFWVTAGLLPASWSMLDWCSHGPVKPSSPKPHLALAPRSQLPQNIAGCHAELRGSQQVGPGFQQASLVHAPHRGPLCVGQAGACMQGMQWKFGRRQNGR